MFISEMVPVDSILLNNISCVMDFERILLEVYHRPIPTYF